MNLENDLKKKMYFCNMIQIGKVIISEELLENEFVCNLSKCKGACCVDGDAGAPLNKDELEILTEIYPKIKHLLLPKGTQAIENQGKYTVNDKGDIETPLIDKKDCAYVIFNDKNIATCGIEEAYNQGIINWKKPISCHLYPVRVLEFSTFTTVNYHHWDICNPACDFGKELQVPVYKFVKEALIRKFGETWYAELKKVADIKKCS